MNPKHRKYIPENETPAAPGKGKIIISACIIAVVVICAFAPALKCGFITLDDPDYVTENAYLSRISFANIKALLTTSFVGTYQPVVNISYLLERHFFGLDASFYHATNILLHLLNCILVLWLILLLDGNILVALTAALLFGLHPLRVESVVWISERKDVLYSFFFLWALVDYCRYIKKNSVRYYYSSLILFLLSLGSKAVAATLPVVFFAVDYLLKRKFDKKVFLEKVPFFMMAFLFGLVAVFAQGRALRLGHGETLMLSRQIAAPFYGIIMYLYNTVLPVKLSLVYPYPPQDTAFYILCAVSAILILIIAAAVFISRVSSRKAAFGFLFALITILPVLQFIPIGDAIMADRYTYLPSIGICYIASAGFFYLYGRRHKYMMLQKTAQLILLAGAMIALFMLTYNRAQLWDDSITLFSDVIKKYPDAYMSYYDRGNVYQKKGDLDKALSDYDKALRLDPANTDVYNNRGNVYQGKGDLDKALADYDKVLTLNPGHADAYNNRGFVYQRKGDLDRALSDYDKALELNPDSGHTYYNRGNVYQRKGDLDRALSDYDKALKLKSGSAEAYNNRGNVYLKKGDLDRALADYDKALELKPDYADAHNNRGFMYQKKGDLDRALAGYDKALKLNPGYAEAYSNRGNLYQKKGDLDRALSDYDKALKLDPGNVDTYNNRGNVYQKKGDTDRALSDYDKALNLNPGYAEAYNNRAVAHFSKKEYDKAWDDVRKLEALGYKVNPALIAELKKATGR